MLPGRAPEITVKFNTRPNIPESGKRVILRLNGENGVAVQATLNRKKLKNQIDKMDALTEWVGVLSGKMSGVTADGVIELMGAGVIVHEKKSTPSSEQQKPDAEKQKSDAEKQKSLTKPKPKPKLPSTQLQESETKSKPAKPIKRKFNFVVK